MNKLKWVSGLEGKNSQLCSESIDLGSHDMIGLVVPLVIVHFLLSLSHPSECILLLRDGVVVIGLQGSVFFEEVLVDLFEGFPLGKNSTSLRLQMVVVVVADEGSSQSQVHGKRVECAHSVIVDAPCVPPDA